MSTRVVCIVTDERVHAAKCVVSRAGVEIVARGTAACATPPTLLLDHDADALSAAISEAVLAAGASGSPVTLVVPQSWCFMHVVTTESPRSTREALRFELESYLPLPLEELTVDLKAFGRGVVLGAAIPTAPARALLDGLQARRIEVEHLVLDAVAGADDAEDSAVAIIDRRSCRVLLSPGTSAQRSAVLVPLSADRSPQEFLAGELQRLLPADAKAPTVWRILDVTSSPSEDSNGEQTGVSIAGIDELLRSVAAQEPAIDLATGDLAGRCSRAAAPRLVQHCLAAACALALVLGIGFHVRTSRLEAAIADLEQVQGEAYRRVFDVAELPPGAGLRLASERIRLEALTGNKRSQGGPSAGETEGAATVGISPLARLREAVAALPSDVRILLSETRIDEQQFLIRGQTAEHRDAERIAEAVAKVPGMEVRPPRTTRLKQGGVEFTIVAVPRSAP